MKYYLIRGNKTGMTLYDEDGTENTHQERPEVFLGIECLKHGCSLIGREQSFRYLTNSKQKAAVLVNEKEQEFWFPTRSRKQKDCEWISYFHVVRAFPKNDNQCEVLFDNGTKQVISASQRTVALQLKRCRLFLQKINEKSHH